MILFFGDFRGFWLSGSTISSKSGYPSAEAPNFDFELWFFVATAMQVEIESQK